MVDALVLEASTSVCGFESHLPHQKKRAPKGAFFFCRPLRRGLPLRSMCGRNLRFPHTRPLPFCDTIQFAIETDRSCHRQGPGAELRSGLFSLPQICSAPSEIQTDRPSHRLPQISPSRIRAAERHTATIHSSLFSIPSSLSQLCPLFPPGRTAKQKYILFFGHLTHNSARYNIGLNLIMEGKEYGKTGSA